MIWEGSLSHVRVFSISGRQDEAENLAIHMYSSYEYKQQGL